MKLEWIVEATPVTGGNLIFQEFDITKYNDLSGEFLTLTPEERKQYKGIEDYVKKKYGIEINNAQKNYKRVMEEIDSNLAAESYLGILPVDLYSEHDTVIDLLASLENENYIKEIYKVKKTRVSSGLNSETAIKLADSIHQGRCLLQSAQKSNMLSKPLIDFYAASAYAYAAIVINSPLHKSLDSLKGSHGHTYNHIDGTIEFGGDVPSGTFIDLLASIYYAQIITKDICFKYITLPSIEFVQNHKICISLIALLSSVPELQDQVSRIPNSQHIVHKMNIKCEVVNKNVSYVFEIGDGKSKPRYDVLEATFSNNSINDVNGKYLVTVPAEDIAHISPTIYQDIRGELYYVEPLIKELYMPEICLHFLIISALCNIMRYSPHEWNNIMTNKISSDFSLLISKYLRLFELKYPMLLTQQFTNFLPIIIS